MRIAILGCGYVANMYRLTLAMHPDLVLAGVYDIERSRAETIARLTDVQAYTSFEALLEDHSIRIVLNLTNPSAHFETTRALLQAGKHVYTEKPLAMTLPEAQALVALAEMKNLLLVSAPCTVLNPVAQTLWRAVRDEVVGPIRLVYAEMDDGMVSRAPYPKWVNEAGMAWPAVDEFETGCTIEHAGYVLTWLCTMFGPATRVTAQSEILIPDKIDRLHIEPAADFSVSTIRFASGVVARMTNGIYARHDHRMRLFGDDGVLTVEDPRSDTSTIRQQRYHVLRRKRFLSPIARRLPLMGEREKISGYRGSQTRDFCRAIVDMAAAIKDGRAPRMDARFALHITELTLASHFSTGPEAAAAGISGMPYHPVTTFQPMEPIL